MQDNVRLIAFDLDGTLTQHKTLLTPANREVLERLSQHYSLLMVGAGGAQRIFKQLGNFPIDVIGNYGMQVGQYNQKTGKLDILSDACVPCDRNSVTERIQRIREAYGYTSYTGDCVEFHESGCVTFPLLGTKASPDEKLRFDPDRSIRRAFYYDVVKSFPEYNVFVGGSSSFDFAPKPYDKYNALSDYCAEHCINERETVFVGDDYGLGGNDETVYLSDIAFREIDDYRQLYFVLFDLL